MLGSHQHPPHQASPSELSHQTSPGRFEKMASEAPSWADQWGAGGFGAIDDDGAKKDEGSNQKKAESKTAFTKAKAAAAAGAQKIKSGTSGGIKWIKNQCQKKGSSK
ncbi:hypothetical protein BT93_E2532 [Corymbia citriodora subsp. variegata]|nr:hypothetical protein BT93_E2532 [Corymbia citriodora subsp. variegata]